LRSQAQFSNQLDHKKSCHAEKATPSVDKHTELPKGFSDWQQQLLLST